MSKYFFDPLVMPAQKCLVFFENHVAPVVFCILEILTFLVMKKKETLVWLERKWEVIHLKRFHASLQENG